MVTQTMQEKDILNDLLVSEKSLCTAYTTYLIESSCPKERTVLNNILQDSHQDQFKTWDAMSKRGYYPVKDATATELEQAKKKYDGILKELS